METNDDFRRDPDYFLRQINEESSGHIEGQGKLKIFFGYAAGVGKTYAMLKDAHDELDKGRDVVVGYIEPHTRADTLALLDGLEQIPPKAIEHKGITIREFDLDAALKRHPEILLVDELAHTNAPGSRHKKRYQDVEELLRAGIDVYTTVNVQHLEGLNDKIAALTQISVSERIPDYLFDHAESVELIDLEPEELIARLESGKIYIPERAQTALTNFFSRKNLASLREISLRRMADRMTRGSTASEGAPQGEAAEDVLVYVTHDTGNAKVIRAAANMAEAFHGTLTALVIESSVSKKLEQGDERRLQGNIELAEELGARVVTLYGDDMALQIAQYATAAGISQIVLGSPSARSERFMAANNLVNRVIRYAYGTSVNVVPVRELPRQIGSYLPKTAFRINLGDALKAVAAVLLAGVVGFLFDAMGMSESLILMAYMLIVLLLATTAEGFFYSFLASLGSMLTYNFFFTEPRFSLDAYGWSSPFIFLFILLSTMLASSLTVRLKRQNVRIAQRAYRTQILLESSRKFQAATSVDECLEILGDRIVKLIGHPAILYRCKPDGNLIPLETPHPADTAAQAPAPAVNGQSEQAIATWVAANNERAGATTPTLGDSQYLYLPISGKKTVYGVLGIMAVHAGEEIEAFEKNLMLATIDECGQTVEALLLSQERQDIEIKAQKESLRANLLRSISHDLRTPLTSISGDADVLISDSSKLTDDQKMQMYRDIHEDSSWLNAMIENLLSITRIGEGSLEASMHPELVGDVMQEALQHINRKSKTHHIACTFDDEFLMASMDAHLIMQVIINLVNNAIAYTPEGSTITLSAKREETAEGARVRIAVADNGPGIPAPLKTALLGSTTGLPLSQRAKGNGDARRGLGLGLALCRSILHVHGSDIELADALPHGSIFSFTLPLIDSPALTQDGPSATQPAQS